ncbi:DNRLRE domain-containing protein [Pseudonocardia sp. GCM10023141]|uniref:DNRLRE domain-containing protein n=1 Tax=Pseudonocardia sp. GCM10023141 TaxID=3252653 RepID=UPI0036225E61
MTRTMVAAAVAAALLTVAPALTPAADAAQPEASAASPLTESSTAVVAPDGKPGLTLYTGPVQLHRGTAWVPVNLTLTAAGDGTVRPLASPQDLLLTPAGPQVRFATGGGTALDWPTVLPAPTLDGPRATYAQAAPGYDLVVEATSAGFMASLRRAGAPPAAPVPPLALRGKVDGATAEGMPTAVGESAVDYVVAAAPPAGPTPAPFDTTVQETVQYSDTSGQPDLRVGTYDGKDVARSFLTFDASGLAKRPVTRATLSLFQTWSSSCQARSWEVWSAAGAGPATRWTNQPALQKLWASSTDTRGHEPACAAGWTTVDVTDLVRSWSDTGAPTGTVALRASDETDTLAWKRFGSAESATVPHLDVTFG